MDRLISEGSLPPEVEEGNCEYKLRIAPIESTRRDGHLLAQMTWRISEGKKKDGVPRAVYFLGIRDDGTIGEQTSKQIRASIINLKAIAKEIGAEVADIKVNRFENGTVACVVVTKTSSVKRRVETRFALIGPTGVGKTTLIANLTYDVPDGEGTARKSVLRYAHEQESGSSSAITCEISGVKNNSIINYTDYCEQVWENIYTDSDRILNFIDLPGDERYSKTTMFGIFAYRPHCIVFVVSPDVKEFDKYTVYRQIAEKLSLDTLVVINKSDCIAGEFVDDVRQFFDTDPVLVSCRTCDGISDLKQRILEMNFETVAPTQDGTKFIVNDVIRTADVGTILTGLMGRGEMSVGDSIFVGPFKGGFEQAKIVSIHKKLVPSDRIFPNETGSIVLDKALPVSKHSVLISDNLLDLFHNRIRLVTDDPSCANICIDSQSVIVFENSVETVSVRSVFRTEDGYGVEVQFVKRDVVRLIEPGQTAVLRTAGGSIVCSVV